MKSLPHLPGRLFHRLLNRAASSKYLLPVLPLFYCVTAALPAHAIDIDVLVGFGASVPAKALYRPETPTPICVYLTGSNTDGPAILKVVAESQDKTVIYTRRITLHSGSGRDAQIENFVINLNRQNFYMRGSGPPEQINIQLQAEGRLIAHKTVALPSSVEDSAFNVLALTKDGSGLNCLTSHKLGLFHRYADANAQAVARSGGNPPTPGKVNGDAVLNLCYTRPEALPTMQQGYEMMDAIALADQPLENLTDSQISALKGWVRAGGLLIVSGGADIARLKAHALADMLPQTELKTVAVSGIPELSGRYHGDLSAGELRTLTGGELRKEARVLFRGAGNTPLVMSEPYGAGTVVLTAFNYMDPAIRGWSAAPALWRDLLQCGMRDSQARHALKGVENAGMGANLLVDALAGRKATSNPGFVLIAVFLVAYVVLLIPASYFVLKKIDKRELAWYTAPAIIALFTFISYLTGLAIKGGSLNVNRAAVLETQAGSDQFAGYAMFSLYSPNRAAYDIVPDADSQEAHDVSPLEIFRGQTLTSELNLDQSGTTTIRGADIGLWDKRSFALPFSHTETGSITAKVSSLKGNKVNAAFTNSGNLTLKDCSVVSGEAVLPVGDLAPGQTKSAQFDWPSSEEDNSVFHISPIAQTQSNGLSLQVQDDDTGTNAEARLKRAITQTLGTDPNNFSPWGNMYGNVDLRYGRPPVALIGWCTDSFLNVRVNGKQPPGNEMNLIVVHIPAPQNLDDGGKLGNNPFEAKPILELAPNVNGPRLVKPAQTGTE